MASSYFQGRAVKQFAWLSIIVLTMTYLLAGLITQPTHVRADQLTDRSIALSTSEAGATVSYTIDFTVPDDGGTDNIQYFRVEFCDSDPLPNLDCVFDGTGDDIPDLDAASLNTDGGTPQFNSVDISLEAITANDHWLDFSLTTPTDIAADTTFSVTIDGIVNPDNSSDGGADNNTFYSRFYVFDDTGAPADPSGTPPVSPSTDQLHEGGAAMSTAEQLTITARVQEILEFCVGTNSSAPAECSAMTGNSVDLGVLDFASINYAIADESNQGSLMVRTNAATGVVVEYFAEQAAAGTEHLGSLRVSGADCDATPSETDQCINSLGTTQAEITAGTENFGMCVPNVDTSSSTGGTTTTNLTVDTEYDGDCDNTAGNGFAFDDSGSTDTIATSVGNGGVVNDEMLVLDFAGTSNITTPSGLYSVTLTFIGTATF